MMTLELDASSPCFREVIIESTIEMKSRIRAAH